MLIAFFVANVPDRCGAFYSDLCLARELRSRGHSIVLINCSPPRGNFAGGVYEGFRWKPSLTAGTELDHSHIWMSAHYPQGNIVRKLNTSYNRHIIFTLHFAGAREMFNFDRPITWSETFWYVNSDIPRSLLNNEFPSRVIHHQLMRPFIELSSAICETRENPQFITLVNTNLNKGLIVLLKIAKALPEYKFLAVRPYYHLPNVAGLDIPPNIIWVDFTRDIKSIYAQTRLLIVPSAYESFCIVAVEAMANGIPVIYSKPKNYNAPEVLNTVGSTEGIEEWIDPVGVQCDREKVDEWVEAIKAFDDEAYYAEKSEAGKALVQPLFGSASQGADIVIETAKNNPAKLGSLTTIQHQVRRERQEAPSVPVVPARPSQPVGWRNGRLSVLRR